MTGQVLLLDNWMLDAHRYHTEHSSRSLTYMTTFLKPIMTTTRESGLTGVTSIQWPCWDWRPRSVEVQSVPIMALPSLEI